MVTVRQATQEDAPAMGLVLDALAAAGRRQKPSDEVFALDHYINHPDQIACHVALDPTGRVLGFQSLKRAVAGNEYGVKPGWGIIGTHVHPGTARQGVGRALMVVTRIAARDAGLSYVDASIGGTNTAALRFYGALGFETYSGSGGVVRKVLSVE